MEKEFINITNPDGSIEEAEIILYFTLKEKNKDYIIYTFNEQDENNLVTLHASRVIEKPSGYVFDKVDNDEDWEKIKEVMRELITENKGE